MTGVSHRLGGAVAGMLVAEVLTHPEDMIGKSIILSAAMLGSLVPDIDNPKSSISYKFPLIRLFVGIFQMLARGLAMLFPRKQEQYIRGMVGHRGISHTLVMVFAGFGLVYNGVFVFPDWQNEITMAAWGIGAGILSHIMLDIFAGGAPICFPFTLKRTTLANIKTGGVVEWLLRTAAIGILLKTIGQDLGNWILSFV